MLAPPPLKLLGGGAGPPGPPSSYAYGYDAKVYGYTAMFFRQIYKKGIHVIFLTSCVQP